MGAELLYQHSISTAVNTDITARAELSRVSSHSVGALVVKHPPLEPGFMVYC